MDRDQLIAEIARETGVRLGPTDPLLAAAVLNEILLDQALTKLDRQVKAQADRVTAASTQAVVDAKKAAEALLTEAGEWAEARIKAAGEAAAAMVLADLRQATAKAERARQVAVWAAWATAIFGLVILSGLGGMALAGFAHG
jgi:hypothetical protein